MRKLLTRCAEIEKLAFQSYTALSHHDYPPALVEIWKDMARDEEAHQRQIEFSMRLLGEKTISGVQISEIQVEAMYSDALSFYSLVKEKKVAEESVITLAIDMENRLSQAHILLSAKFSDPKLAEMFTFLARSDQTHMEGLVLYKAELLARGGD